jgi:hypothetical protein
LVQRGVGMTSVAGPTSSQPHDLAVAANQSSSSTANLYARLPSQPSQLLETRNVRVAASTIHYLKHVSGMSTTTNDTVNLFSTLVYVHGYGYGHNPILTPDFQRTRRIIVGSSG